MKLSIVGAGSSRLPLMLASVAKAARERPLAEVALYDVRPDRIEALLPVARALAGECGTLPRVTISPSPEACLEGADAAVFTIRPGFEEARAADERACLDLGVIGQETTGPAGFAFACRSLPALIDLCRIAVRSNPHCLLVVFTNPAGLVTRGLLDAGYERAVGVCDSANVAVNAVARQAGIDPRTADFDVYGLNHLSWTRRVTSGGRDLLAEALADDDFLARTFPAFPADRLQSSGRIPVEYLWYFYLGDKAFRLLAAEPTTRGESLVEANRAMFAAVGSLASDGNIEDAVVAYADYLTDRHATYMDYARGGDEDVLSVRSFDDAVRRLQTWVGGYAEVAMDLLAARTDGASRLMALNVRNNGALPGMADDDVVETDCVVDRTGIRPRFHAPLAPEDLELVLRVAEYERLAARAIRERSTALAEDALAAHPLVPSRDLARRLVAALVTWNARP